jgi:phage gpG-like protein
MVTFKVETASITATIDRFRDKVSDLRPAFIQIAAEFYKTNRAIFKLKGPGKYTDFVGPKIANTWMNPGLPAKRIRNGNMTAYQWAKTKRRWPGVNAKGYPLLKASGVLENSITRDNDPNSVKIITKMSLILGTTVPYGIYHQSDEPRKTNLPMRKFLFIDPSTTFDDPALSRRSEAWTKLISNYVERLIPNG